MTTPINELKKRVAVYYKCTYVHPTNVNKYLTECHISCTVDLNALHKQKNIMVHLCKSYVFLNRFVIIQTKFGSIVEQVN